MDVSTDKSNISGRGERAVTQILESHPDSSGWRVVDTEMAGIIAATCALSQRTNGDISYSST